MLPSRSLSAIRIGRREGNSDKECEFLDKYDVHRLSRPHDIELIAKTAQELAGTGDEIKTLFCYNKYVMWGIHQLWETQFIARPNILIVL